MKLIIFTGLLAACTAASLEHLEQKQISYLPAAKDSSSSSKDSDVEEGSLGADTNANGAATDSQIELNARSSVSGSSKPNSSFNKDLSSSASDSEFAGYFYGPGVQNLYNQKSNLQANSQFGTQTHNQQFDQQGTNKYFSHQNHGQMFGTQGSTQQFGKQQQNQLLEQQFGQQLQNQQFGQKTHSMQPQNKQFNQQKQLVNQQQFGQQTYNQQFGQQPLMQQYSQQYQNQYDASSQGTNNFGAQVRYQPRPSFVNNQKSHSSQNYPQQAFDEKTGYHY